jgi:hypothetical protein
MAQEVTSSSWRCQPRAADVPIDGLDEVDDDFLLEYASQPGVRSSGYSSAASRSRLCMQALTLPAA